MDLERRTVLERYMALFAHELEFALEQQLLEVGFFPEKVAACVTYVDAKDRMTGDPTPTSVPQIYLLIDCPCPETMSWIEARDYFEVGLRRGIHMFNQTYPAFPLVPDSELLPDAIGSRTEFSEDDPTLCTVTAEIHDLPKIEYLGRYPLQLLAPEPYEPMVQLKEPL